MKYVILFVAGALGTVAILGRNYPEYRPYLQTLKPVGPRFRKN